MHRYTHTHACGHTQIKMCLSKIPSLLSPEILPGRQAETEDEFRRVQTERHMHACAQTRTHTCRTRLKRHAVT